MRSTEERVAAVKERAKILEDNTKRRNRAISLGAVVACIVMISFVAVNMPDVVDSLSAAQLKYGGAAASIFADESALGYIFIGLVSFVLGCGVTILSFYLKRKETGEPGDGIDG